MCSMYPHFSKYAVRVSGLQRGPTGLHDTLMQALLEHTFLWQNTMVGWMWTGYEWPHGLKAGIQSGDVC